MRAEVDSRAPVYFLPVPRPAPHLSASEMTLVGHGENGLLAGHLLARSGLEGEVGRRSLVSLFEKRVLTLSMGEASDAWKWHALVRRGAQVQGKLPEIVRARRDDLPVRAESTGGRNTPPPCLPRVASERAPGR